MNNDRPNVEPTEWLWSVRLQQRDSWQQGQKLTVEMLITLSNSPPTDDQLLELILSEYQLRAEFGEHPLPEEYVQRFPQLRQRLERLFAVHAAMENTNSGQVCDDPTDSELPRIGLTVEQILDTDAHTSTQITKPKLGSLGSYELLEKIGAGGMGSVYKARHLKLKKIVAIKVLPEHLTTETGMTARFQREIESAGALDHPNIVRALDAGEINGTHYLVMELVEGEDLAKVIKHRGPMPVNEAIALIRQTAEALQYAHDHGLIHRDIKPSNLMLTRENRVKLLDLGLARWQLEAQIASESDLTESGQTLGTIDYMSPEQAQDPKGVDERADVYSLGCTFYFLLTGKPLYAGRGRVAKLFAHRDDPIPSLLSVRNDVTEELDGIYQRMVAKGIDNRYASMIEILSALENVHRNPDQVLEPQSKSPANGLDSASKHSKTNSKSKSEQQSTTDELTVISRPLSLRKHYLWWAAGLTTAIVLFALLAFPSIDKRPENGTVVVTVNESNANVDVYNNKEVLELTQESDGTPITISLEPGAHRLEFHKEGFEPLIEEFSIESAGTKTFEANLVAKTVRKQQTPEARTEIIPPITTTPQSKTEQESWAMKLALPVEQTNSMGMKFRLIPPGEFQMGAPDSDKDARDNERPRHLVKITRPFYLGSYEVTQLQYSKVMGTNPSHWTFKSNPQANSIVVHPLLRHHPTDSVTWIEANEFCALLGSKDHRRYRLPTEAEWEYACRAESITRFPTGDSVESVYKIANFALGSSEEEKSTLAVGSFAANNWGLYDMNGSIFEWCSDRFGKYEPGTAINPTGPASGELRTVRGGCYYYRALDGRSSSRFGLPDGRAINRGFRVVMEIGELQNLKSSPKQPAVPSIPAKK